MRTEVLVFVGIQAARCLVVVVRVVVVVLETRSAVVAVARVLQNVVAACIATGTFLNTATALLRHQRPLILFAGGLPICHLCIQHPSFLHHLLRHLFSLLTLPVDSRKCVENVRTLSQIPQEGQQLQQLRVVRVSKPRSDWKLWGGCVSG